MNTPRNSSNRNPAFPDPRQGRSGSGPIPPVNADSDLRLPHERDESPDSQDRGEPRKLMRQAQHDLEGGLKDTDRGTPMDDTYHRVRETSAKPDQRVGQHAPAEHMPAQPGYRTAQGRLPEPGYGAVPQVTPGPEREAPRFNEQSASGARSGGTRTAEGTSYGDYAPAREPGTDPTRTPEFDVDRETGQVSLVEEGTKPTAKK